MASASDYAAALDYEDRKKRERLGPAVEALNEAIRNDTRPRFYPISRHDLEQMPTICQTNDADLKMEGRNWRVWYSRMTTDDGPGIDYDHMVLIEQRRLGEWTITERWRTE